MASAFALGVVALTVTLPGTIDRKIESERISKIQTGWSDEFRINREGK